ncbi:MAG: addiction module protein [Proteobacteria bacterium]|nr:addiction module protein [Pseudomonadota bacterium]
MATNFEELKKEVQSLSMQEKATLAHTLIEDLDNVVDEDVEALWIEEAQTRYEAYHRGDLQAIPGEEAMQRVRQRLK